MKMKRISTGTIKYLLLLCFLYTSTAYGSDISNIIPVIKNTFTGEGKTIYIMPYVIGSPKNIIDSSHSYDYGFSTIGYDLALELLEKLKEEKQYFKQHRVKIASMENLMEFLRKHKVYYQNFYPDIKLSNINGFNNAYIVKGSIIDETLDRQKGSYEVEISVDFFSFSKKEALPHGSGSYTTTYDYSINNYKKHIIQVQTPLLSENKIDLVYKLAEAYLKKQANDECGVSNYTLNKHIPLDEEYLKKRLKRMQVARQILHFACSPAFDISLSSIQHSITNISSGKADLTFLSPDEGIKKDLEQKENNFNLIAKDAVAIIVHNLSPIKTLKALTVSNIFMQRYKNWPDVPKYNQRLHGNITLHTFKKGYGPYDFFTEYIRNKNNLSSHYHSVKSTYEYGNKMQERINDDSTYFSIGYISCEDRTTSRAIKIGPQNNAVLPDKQTLIAGTYPLIKPIYLYAKRHNPNRVVNNYIQGFTDFIQSNAGRAAISKLACTIPPTIPVPPLRFKDKGFFYELSKKATHLFSVFYDKKVTDLTKNEGVFLIQINKDLLNNGLKKIELLDNKAVLVFGYADGKGKSSPNSINLNLSTCRAHNIKRKIRKNNENIRVISIGFGDEYAEKGTEDQSQRKVDVFSIDNKKVEGYKLREEDKALCKEF